VKPRIFIDGSEGTTGLQIADRLAGRDDLELIYIDPDKRKDPDEIRRMMSLSDITFLCLPDAAAREAVTLAEGLSVRIIDASTAHRTAQGWVYGFPELLPGQRGKIANAKYLANPGCHATGFLSVAAPLVQGGILPKNYPVSCYSLTGYSGGGKKMIASYENEKTADMYSPRVYGLSMNHKHLPEMKAYSGLDLPPAFSPIVDDYYKGMATSIMVQNSALNKCVTAKDIHAYLSEFYADGNIISVRPLGDGTGMLPANALSGSDRLEICVSGSEDHTIITALFDNLGKGASGAAVQNMNLMLGFEETTGLSLI